MIETLVVFLIIAAAVGIQVLNRVKPVEQTITYDASVRQGPDWGAPALVAAIAVLFVVANAWEYLN